MIAGRVVRLMIGDLVIATGIDDGRTVEAFSPPAWSSSATLTIRRRTRYPKRWSRAKRKQARAQNARVWRALWDAVGGGR